MLPPHHLPQLIPTRLQSAIRRLHENIWTNHRPLSVEATAVLPEQRSLQNAKKETLYPVNFDSFWGRLFDQRWCRVKLPEATDDKTWLNWEDQGEATLYVDDVPYFGFNVAHRHCRLPKGVQELWIQSSCVQSGIVHHDIKPLANSGSHFTGAFICRRNDETWEAYHDLKCLFDVFADQRHRENPDIPLTPRSFGLQAPLGKAAPVYRRMLRVLDEALDVLDAQGVPAFREQMQKAYEEFRSDKSFMRCILTGHAHLDLVWLWPERVGELKAINIFATVNRLMDEYPDFRFAYSQPASYDAVNRREPKLLKQVRQRISSGQWQATGAMYVESDTTLPCGEALARSFVLGQKGFIELAGKPSKLTWLPDVFGYSACLPQIMRLNGVEYFFTTKMTWNAINRFPYSSFIWRGSDGSEVISHVTQDASYVSHMKAADIRNPMLAHRQADVHREFLLPTGYGDGGGGPTHEMCERARRLGALPNMPEISWDQPEAFFERLSSVRNSLPTHQGECYLEYHRGTYTTHGNFKACFRELERALFTAEAVSSITGKHWDLDSPWKRLIFAQFHDYIPGSSVWDVYLEGIPKLEKLASDQLWIAKSTLSSEGVPCIFNPHAMQVRRWVKNPSTGKGSFISLPPLSGTPIEQTPAESPEPVSMHEHTVSNGLSEFTLSADGFIKELILDGHPIPLSGPVGQLMLYPDKAANFESWDIDRHVLSAGEVCKSPATIIPFNSDGVRAGFSVLRKVGEKSSAAIELTLESGSPLLNISIKLDWQEPEHLLKLLVPTRYSASNARFGTPYGSILRSQINNGLAAEAMWEVPFSRHMEVFDEGERDGLALLSESKYGVSVRNGEIGLSLVRSPRVTGFDSMSLAWPPYLTRLEIPSPCSDIGKHTIRLALGHYDITSPREYQPAALAETLFTSPISYTGKAIPSPISEIDGAESLIPCWSIPLDKNSWILRFHEVSGQRGAMKITSSDEWTLCKAEFDGTPLSPGQTSTLVEFTPYQIISLRFDRRTL